MKNNLFLVWGQEPYLIEEHIRNLTEQINLEQGGEVETIALDADEISPMQLAEILEFSPLFSLARIIVIKRPFWLTKSKRKNSRIEETARVWANYLQRPPDQQFIIFTAEEYAPTNVVIKTLGKALQVVEGKSLGTAQLKKWLGDQFAAHGTKVDENVLSLLSSTGQDMYYLKNLIEKVCLIANGRKIVREDFDEDLIRIENTTVFKITDELFKRNARNAISNLQKYIEQDQPIPMALFMIVRQFINLGKVKYYREKGYTSKEIAEITKLREFQIRNMENNLNNFTDKELKEIFTACLQADIDIKSTGKDNLLVIETLLYEICSGRHAE
ncbi:MAG: DNA polymerase III subunit delta [Syntrophomonadaceae bacterium]|nr:DNA polymerase III subunit delta [Syntrophomonadaceae bacterium]